MTRRVLRARILVAAAGLVLALCLRPAPSEPTPPRAERPSYRVGDTWVLDRGVYELKRIDGDTYVFQAGPGQEIHLTKDLGIARVVFDGRAGYDVARAAEARLAASDREVGLRPRSPALGAATAAPRFHRDDQCPVASRRL
jgi:hypothetical protein